MKKSSLAPSSRARKRPVASIPDAGLAAGLFAHASDGILVVSPGARITDANPAFTRLTGYPKEDVVGRNPRFLRSKRQNAAFFGALGKELVTRGAWRGEIWIRRKDGVTSPQVVSIFAVQDERGRLQHFVGMCADISTRLQHQAALEKIADYDPVTGLPTRRLLAERLCQAVTRVQHNGKRLAVCRIDLDNSRSGGESIGGAARDRLLIEASNRLREALRPGDTLAHIAGNEFVLLLENLPREDDSLGDLDRVMTAVRVPASIGIAVLPPDVADPEILLKHAGQAMYRAKESGGNIYQLFDADQDHRMQARRSQLHRLATALRCGEFVLHYQPKVDLGNGEVVGTEALIRWQHPADGLVPPSAFLHYIEGSELEMAVSVWVVETALSQMQAWRASGIEFVTSVNVSAQTLLHPDFLEQLQHALQRHASIPADCLELEVVETAAFSNEERATETLHRCRELGVRFALDDFGTGYSSLAYFRNLPVDVLKVDQSFVRDMLDDPNDLDIVDSIVRLARAMNRQVVAEGVETLEHGAVLLSIGCRICQGYGIAAPMPADQLPAWMEKWRDEMSWVDLNQLVGTYKDMALLAAAKTHRRWVDRVLECIGGGVDHDHAPERNPSRCRFGRWYLTGGASRYGSLPEFHAIGPIHQAVHALGAQMLELADEGKTQAARQHEAELYELRDQLLEQLDLLLEKVADPIGTG